MLVDTAVSITVLRARDYVPLLNNIEWMAPELFPWGADADSNHTPVWTKESDVYAFARTVEEVRCKPAPMSR